MPCLAPAFACLFVFLSVCPCPLLLVAVIHTSNWHSRQTQYDEADGVPPRLPGMPYSTRNASPYAFSFVSNGGKDRGHSCTRETKKLRQAWMLLANPVEGPRSPLCRATLHQRGTFEYEPTASCTEPPNLTQPKGPHPILAYKVNFSIVLETLSCPPYVTPYW